jgi:hypothetical protein
LTNCLLCALRSAGGGLAGGLARSGAVGSGLTGGGLASSGLASSGLTSSGLTSSGLTSSGLTSSGLTSSGLNSSSGLAIDRRNDKQGISPPLSTLLEKYSSHRYSGNSYSSSNTNLSENTYSATNTNLLANSYSNTNNELDQSYSYTSTNPTYTEVSQFQYKDLAELKTEAIKDAQKNPYKNPEKNQENDIFSDNKYKDLFRVNNDNNRANNYDYDPKNIDYDVSKKGNAYILPALKKTENTSKYPEKYPEKYLENSSKYAEIASKYGHDEDEGYQLNGNLHIYL